MPRIFFQYFSRFSAGLVASFALLAATLPARAALIVDTGSNQDGVSLVLSAGQYFGAEFTLDGPVEVRSIEGLIGVSAPGDVAFAIHADGGTVPGDVLFSTTESYSGVDMYEPEWRGAMGLIWTLGAGTYWVSIKPDYPFYGRLLGDVPNPLAAHAQGVYGEWTGLDPGLPFRVSIAVRIDAVPVPEPSTYALAAIGVVAILAIKRRKR